jgi:hypothetical protein
MLPTEGVFDQVCADTYTYKFRDEDPVALALRVVGGPIVSVFEECMEEVLSYGLMVVRARAKNPVRE